MPFSARDRKTYYEGGHAVTTSQLNIKLEKTNEKVPIHNHSSNAPAIQQDASKAHPSSRDEHEISDHQHRWLYPLYRREEPSDGRRSR